MNIQHTDLDGVYIIELTKISDSRGDFVRTFCKKELAQAGITFDIVQESQSLTNKKGTIRGLHYQSEPMEEAKLVRCLKGKIFDVIVNIQTDSEQFGKFYVIELSGENDKMVYIPKGFAHGFQTLTENCVVDYKMNQYYSEEHAIGVAWNDPFFNIKWPIVNWSLSEKDRHWDFIKKNE